MRLGLGRRLVHHLVANGQHPFVRINALFAANFFKSVAYHPDESQLLTCGTDRKITYWDVLNMNAIRIIDGSDTADVNSLHVNEDGRFFVSGGADKKVNLWNYDEGSVRAAALFGRCCRR